MVVSAPWVEGSYDCVLSKALRPFSPTACYGQVDQQMKNRMLEKMPSHAPTCGSSEGREGPRLLQSAFLKVARCVRQLSPSPRCDGKKPRPQPQRWYLEAFGMNRSSANFCQDCHPCPFARLSFPAHKFCSLPSNKFCLADPPCSLVSRISRDDLPIARCAHYLPL